MSRQSHPNNNSTGHSAGAQAQAGPSGTRLPPAVLPTGPSSNSVPPRAGGPSQAQPSTARWGATTRARGAYVGSWDSSSSWRNSPAPSRPVESSRSQPNAYVEPHANQHWNHMSQPVQFDNSPTPTSARYQSSATAGPSRLPREAAPAVVPALPPASAYVAQAATAAIKPASATAIFVGLPLACTDQQLRAFIEKKGHAVERTHIMADRLTPGGKRFGFATFASVDAARAFVGPNFPSLRWKDPYADARAKDDGLTVQINYSTKFASERDDTRPPPVERAPPARQTPAKAFPGWRPIPRASTPPPTSSLSAPQLSRSLSARAAAAAPSTSRPISPWDITPRPALAPPAASTVAPQPTAARPPKPETQPEAQPEAVDVVQSSAPRPTPPTKSVSVEPMEIEEAPASASASIPAPGETSSALKRSRSDDEAQPLVTQPPAHRSEQTPPALESDATSSHSSGLVRLTAPTSDQPPGTLASGTPSLNIYCWKVWYPPQLDAEKTAERLSYQRECEAEVGRWGAHTTTVRPCTRPEGDGFSIRYSVPVANINSHPPPREAGPALVVPRRASAPAPTTAKAPSTPALVTSDFPAWPRPLGDQVEGDETEEDRVALRWTCKWPPAMVKAERKLYQQKAVDEVGRWQAQNTQIKNTRKGFTLSYTIDRLVWLASLERSKLVAARHHKKPPGELLTSDDQTGMSLVRWRGWYPFELKRSLVDERALYRRECEAEVRRWQPLSIDFGPDEHDDDLTGSFSLTYAIPSANLNWDPPARAPTATPIRVAKFSPYYISRITQELDCRSLRSDSQRSNVPPATNSVVDEAHADGLLREEIDLPPTCAQNAPDFQRHRLTFQRQQLRKAAGEGKLVSSSKFVGDKFVLVILPDDDEPIDSDQQLPPPPPQPPAPAPIERTPAEPQPRRQTTPPPLFERASPSADVKPVIPPSSPELDPQPIRARRVERGPLPVFARPFQPSSADSHQTREQAELFVNQFFKKFDSSKESLADFYAHSAKFSFLVETSVPSRLRHAPPSPAANIARNPFKPALIQASCRAYVTPEPIVNAFKLLPVGEHLLEQLRYDARAMPELGDRPGAKYPPLLVHVVGIFDEFPTHVKRRITRVFVLVPRRAGSGCPLPYAIQTDQLTIGYHLNDNRPWAVDESLWTPTPAVARGARNTSQPPRPSSAASAKSTPIVPASQAPTSTRSDPVDGQHPTSGGAAADEPETDELDTSDSDDDIQIIEQLAPSQPPPTEQRPAKRRARSPAAPPRPPPSLNEQQAAKAVADTIAAASPGATLNADEMREMMKAIAMDAVKEALASASSAHSPRLAAPPTPSSSVAGSSTRAPRLAANRKLVKMTASHSVQHQYGGVGNKMRQLFRLGGDQGYLALSSQGDVMHWNGGDQLNSKTLLHRGDVGDKVETGSFDADKEALVIGFLSPGKDGEVQQPRHQIGILKTTKHGGAFRYTAISQMPHVGGVSAVAIEPTAAKKRLKWISAGEDKTLVHWTKRNSEAGTAETARLKTEHTSTIADLSFRQDGRFFYSAGLDKRVVGYDHQRSLPSWSTFLDARVLLVTPVPGQDNLILSRKGSIDKQFTIHDLRMAESAANFGFTIAPTVNAAGKSTPATVGRFLRGDWHGSLYAHPDSAEGVRLWDIRYLNEAANERARPRVGYGQGVPIAEQHVAGIGRSRLLECSWSENGNELALLGLRTLAKVSVAVR